MATQGIVSLVDENGNTIVKVIVGCNGYNADGLIERIKAEGLKTAVDIYSAAIVHDFGCPDCLVVMDNKSHIFKGGDELSSLYRETFSKPEFNPRWKYGTADFTRVCSHVT